ncbi:DUF1835 domain-containing protein [Burkholderia glumae]|uniref:DUF1835 domain-containing protein n=1 Tax=Burkholderia glumae TaxID=337 RepID=A0AAP9Y104_BURGL|nr:DUF1835 domain-containing protein [Burkholderia glumae]ACR27437.1 Hypothetical protein bglu_1g02360 [Burkholderia glumae BGR1]AJY67213.1 hypothetical protein KS03_1170 [Burkholderia glumae LMG 2196 = ATCC 33617]KHJ62412.1 hypothetical protein NCPPB3923_13615 [Burkholderia glumae]MCM2481603.1 DUF1835 domain-containing protein [Burkholderia glumae]MCM2508257.1 DUF1835 domain-containing protein [Burkholderia glumae]
MSTLHVTVGGSAAESLRAALAAAGRDNAVVELLDDLAVGPLRGIDDAPEPRAAFWERIFADTPPDWDSRLAAELDKLARLAAGSGQVVIWHAQSAADQLMLRRVAYHLRHAPQRLNEVRLSAADLGPRTHPPGREAAVSVDMFGPERLRAKLPEAAPISVLRIGRLALEWQEAKQVNAELRYWIDNTFKSGHYADIDALALEQAGEAWMPAARVVGAIIALANRGHLRLGDSIAFWRCRELAAAGRLELRGGAPGPDNLRAASLRAVPAAAPR